jgi:hypothetical protein
LYIAIGVVIAGFTATTGQAQDRKSSNLGPAGVGALGVYYGQESMERSTEGSEIGALLDLGWTRTPSLRIQAEVGFMRAMFSEFVEVEDTTYSGPIYDFSVGVSALLSADGPSRRLVPYLLAGAAVHALSSTFEALVLDQRFNANPFGVHAGAGVRIWLTPSGRNALGLEVRRVIAENVDRTSLRAGLLFLFNDLIRPR